MQGESGPGAQQGGGWFPCCSPHPLLNMICGIGPSPTGAPPPGLRSRNVGHPGSDVIDLQEADTQPLLPLPLTSDPLSSEQKSPRSNPVAHLTGEGDLGSGHAQEGCGGQIYLHSLIQCAFPKFPRAQALGAI
jgi:hypothetical protein